MLEGSIAVLTRQLESARAELTAALSRMDGLETQVERQARTEMYGADEAKERARCVCVASVGFGLERAVCAHVFPAPKTRSPLPHESFWWCPG